MKVIYVNCGVKNEEEERSAEVKSSNPMQAWFFLLFFFFRLSFSINYVFILRFSLIEEPSREKKERKREKELVKTEGTFIAHL